MTATTTNRLLRQLDQAVTLLGLASSIINGAAADLLDDSDATDRGTVLDTRGQLHAYASAAVELAKLITDTTNPVL